MRNLIFTVGVIMLCGCPPELPPSTAPSSRAIESPPVINVDDAGAPLSLLDNKAPKPLEKTVGKKSEKETKGKKKKADAGVK